MKIHNPPVLDAQPGLFFSFQSIPMAQTRLGISLPDPDFSLQSIPVVVEKNG
jgi:hypothetical protein